MENSPDYYNELSVDDSSTNYLSQLINFDFKGGYNNLFKKNDTNKLDQDEETDKKTDEETDKETDEETDKTHSLNNSHQTGGDTVEVPTTQTVNFNTKNDRMTNPQPAQVQYEFKAFYPKQIPQKPNYVMPSVITPGMNTLSEGNAKYIMPIVNNININGLDPFNSKTNLAPIVEYLLPLSNISEIFNTIKDRQLISDFIKSVLLFNEDGIIVDSLKYNIKKLMNSLKVVKMNPYVSQEMYGKISPFKFPVNFLLYKSCFPIKYIQNTIKCEKNSTHVNLRFYRIPRGDVLDRRNPDVINVSKALSEMKYYNYVKNEIVYKHESPNFVLMYGYNFYNDKDVIFNEGDPNIKKQEDTIEEMNPKLYEQIYNELRYYIYRKYIESNNGAINFVEHNTRLKEEINSFCIEHHLTIAELQQQTLDQLITKYLIMIDANLKKKAISLINTITLHNKYLNDFILAITESPTYSIYDWASKIYADNIGIRTMINTGYHSHFQWMSIIFQMLTAFHSLAKHKIFIPNFKLGENIYIYNIPNVPTNPKVWKYLVDGVEYFIPNYGDFVMIDSSFKTKNMSDTIKTYGKEYVDNIMSINNDTIENEEEKNKHKQLIDSIFNDYNTMLISLMECFNISNFKDNVFYSRGGTVPEGKTLELIDKIYTYLHQNIGLNMFKNAIHMFMGQFLNNRVGTYLQDDEAREQLREVNNETPSGTYIVYLNKSGRYKIGVYVNNSDEPKEEKEDEEESREEKEDEEESREEKEDEEESREEKEDEDKDEEEKLKEEDEEDKESENNTSNATINFVSDEDTNKIKQNLNSINVITEKGLIKKVSNIVYTLPSDYELTQINTNEMIGDRTASGILDTFNIN